MENSSKFIISEEYSSSLKDMMNGSSEDSSFAMTILENRDEKNEESEKRFQDLLITYFNSKVFRNWRTAECWVIRLNGQLLVANSRSAFESRGDAMNHLSRHCTSYIGTKDDNSHRGSDKIFRAIKSIFKGGKQLRDYLVKHNIITIEQVK